MLSEASSSSVPVLPIAVGVAVGGALCLILILFAVQRRRRNVFKSGKSGARSGIAPSFSSLCNLYCRPERCPGLVREK